MDGLAFYRAGSSFFWSVKSRLGCFMGLEFAYWWFTQSPGSLREHGDCGSMKTKTRHKKSYKWRKRADSSPIAKGRRPKRQGRNPKKSKHLGGVGLK